jgi:hypothetical protein
MSLDEAAHPILHVDAGVLVGGLCKDLFVAAGDEPLKIRGCYRVSGSRVQTVVCCAANAETSMRNRSNVPVRKETLFIDLLRE